MTDEQGSPEDQADVASGSVGRGGTHGNTGSDRSVDPDLNVGAARSVEGDAASRPGAPDDDDDGLFPAPVRPAPRTGDGLIDSALSQLEESASSGTLDDQIEAGEKVHRTLQGRLSDVGGT